MAEDHLIDALPAGLSGAVGRSRGAGGLDRRLHRHLGRALRELLDRTRTHEGMVALLAGDDKCEVRHTPGLASPPEAVLRHLASKLVGSHFETVFLGETPPLVATTLEVGDGSEVLAAIQIDSPEQRSLFETAAPHLLLTLARDILLLYSRRREDEVERLNATARRVAESLDLDQVLAEIVRDAVELLGADEGDIILHDPQAQTLRIVAATWRREVVGMEWEADQGLAARVMAARRTLAVRDYSRYRYRIRQLERYGARAALAAPLIVRETTIGALTVHSTDPGYEFDRHHARLLSAFASHAAVAIDNARRYQAEARLARELKEVNEQLARSLTLQRRLVEQVLLDRGVAAIARELADLLQRPLVLHDHLLRVLAGAAPDGGEQWRALSLPSDALGDPALATFLAELARSHAPAAAPAPLRGGPQRLVVPIVRAASEVSGYLVLPWQGELDSLDRALIEVAMTGVALELAKLHARIDLERELRGEVVMDLVRGSFSSAETIAARVAEIGFDLSEPRCVALLRLRGVDPALPPLTDPDQLTLRRRFVDLVTARVTALSPASMVAADSDLVVVLAARGCRARRTDDVVDSARRLLEQVLESVRASLPGARVSAAIGDVCHAAEHYAASFRLARGTLQAAEKLGSAGQVVDARSLGATRLIITGSAEPELREFARRMLGPLLDGGEFERALRATLRAYVECGFNQRETARRAYLHPNTVFHRLRAIEERLGIDLDDPATRLDLNLALRIAALADMLV